MRKIAPAPIARRTGRSKRSRVLSPPATGNGGTKSKLGQKKEMLGPAGGTDYRPKAPIKVEVEDGIGVLYSRIGKEWSMLV